MPPVTSALPGKKANNHSSVGDALMIVGGRYDVGEPRTGVGHTTVNCLEEEK